MVGRALKSRLVIALLLCSLVCSALSNDGDGKGGDGAAAGNIANKTPMPTQASIAQNRNEKDRNILDDVVESEDDMWKRLREGDLDGAADEAAEPTDGEDGPRDAEHSIDASSDDFSDKSSSYDSVDFTLPGGVPVQRVKKTRRERHRKVTFSDNDNTSNNSDLDDNNNDDVSDRQGIIKKRSIVADMIGFFAGARVRIGNFFLVGETELEVVKTTLNQVSLPAAHFNVKDGKLKIGLGEPFPVAPSPSLEERITMPGQVVEGKTVLYSGSMLNSIPFKAYVADPYEAQNLPLPNIQLTATEFFIIDDVQWAHVVQLSNDVSDCLETNDGRHITVNNEVVCLPLLLEGDALYLRPKPSDSDLHVVEFQANQVRPDRDYVALLCSPPGVYSQAYECVSARSFKISWLGYPGPKRSAVEAAIKDQDGFGKQLSVHATVTMRIHTLASKSEQLKAGYPVPTSIPYISGREFDVHIGFEATSGVSLKVKGKDAELNGLSIRQLDKPCRRESEDVDMFPKFHECVYRRFLVLATTVYRDENPWVPNVKVDKDESQRQHSLHAVVWKRVTKYMLAPSLPDVVKTLIAGCESNLNYSKLGFFARYRKESMLAHVLAETEFTTLYYSRVLYYMGYVIGTVSDGHLELLDVMDDLRLNIEILARVTKGVPRKRVRAELQTALTRIRQIRARGVMPSTVNDNTMAQQAIAVETLIYREASVEYGNIKKRVKLTFLGARERDARLVPQTGPAVGFVKPELLFYLSQQMRIGGCYEVNVHGYGCDREASPCKWVENTSSSDVHGTIIRGTAMKDGREDMIVLDLGGLPHEISSYILSFVKPERWTTRIRKLIDVKRLLDVVQNTEYYQNYLIDLANYAGNHDEFEFTSSVSLENLAMSNDEQSSLPVSRDMIRKRLTTYIAKTKGLHVVFNPHEITDTEVRFTPPPELPTPFKAMTLPDNRIHLYGRRDINRVVYCKNAASCDYIYALVKRKPVHWDRGIGALMTAGPTSLRLYEFTDELKDAILQTRDEYQVEEMIADIGTATLPLPVLIPSTIPEVESKFRPRKLKESQESSVYLYQMKRLPFSREGKKYLLAHCYVPYTGNYRCYDVRVWAMKAALTVDERERRKEKRRRMAQMMYANQIATRTRSQAYLYKCEDDMCDGGGILDRVKSDHGVLLPFRFSKGLIDDFTVENLSIDKMKITVAPTNHFGVDIRMDGIVLKVVFNIYPHAFSKVGLGDLPVLIDMAFAFDYKVSLHPTLSKDRNPIVSEVSFLKNGVKVDGVHISSFNIRSSKLEGLLRAGAASKIEGIKDKIAFLLSKEKLDEALTTDKIQPILNEVAWWMLENHRKGRTFNMMDKDSYPIVAADASVSLKNVYLTRDQRREVPSIVYELHRMLSKAVEIEPDIYLEQVAGVAPPDMMLLWGSVHGPLLQGKPQAKEETVAKVYMHCSGEGGHNPWSRSDKRPRVFSTEPSVRSVYKIPANQFAYVFEKRSSLEKCSIVFEIMARSGGVIIGKWVSFARAKLKLKTFARSFLSKGVAAVPVKDQVILYDFEDNLLCGALDSDGCKAQLSFSLGIRWMNRDAATRIMDAVNEGMCVDRWDNVLVPLITSYTREVGEKEHVTIDGARGNWCVSVCEGIFEDPSSQVFRRCSYNCIRTAENTKVSDARFCQVFCHEQFPVTISKCEKACIGKVITTNSIYGDVSSEWSDVDARSSAKDSDASSNAEGKSPVKALKGSSDSEDPVVVREGKRHFKVEDKLESLERRRINAAKPQGAIAIPPMQTPPIDGGGSPFIDEIDM